MKKKYWFGILIVALLGLAGFTFLNKHQESSQKKQQITLASSPGPYSDLFLKGIKPILEKEGYEVHNKSFVNLLNADVALNEGQVDLNVDQHTAYLNNFNKEKHGHLEAITKIPTVPMGIYPAQKHSLKAISDGDKIAISNDPSNTARAYQLLEKAGWIKLKKGIDPIKATKNDIVANKYNLQITEVDSATIPRSANDFDYVVLPGSIAYNAKIPSSKMLLAENVQNNYFLVAAINDKNAKQPWVKAVKKAYESKAFADYVKTHNHDNYWVVPKK